MSGVVESLEEDAGVVTAMAGARIKLGAIFLLVVALAVVGWLYRKEIRASAELAQRVLQQQVAIDDMSRQLQDAEQRRRAAERIAAKHLADLQEIQKQARRWRHEIEKLKKERPDVAAWADQPIPDAVLDRLRCSAAGDHKNKDCIRNASGSVLGRSANAGIRGPDKR